MVFQYVRIRLEARELKKTRVVLKRYCHVFALPFGYRRYFIVLSPQVPYASCFRCAFVDIVIGVFANGGGCILKPILVKTRKENLLVFLDAP